MVFVRCVEFIVLVWLFYVIKQDFLKEIVIIICWFFGLVNYFKVIYEFEIYIEDFFDMKVCFDLFVLELEGQNDGCECDICIFFFVMNSFVVFKVVFVG